MPVVLQRPPQCRLLIFHWTHFAKQVVVPKGHRDTWQQTISWESTKCCHASVWLIWCWYDLVTQTRAWTVQSGCCIFHLSSEWDPLQSRNDDLSRPSLFSVSVWTLCLKLQPDPELGSTFWLLLATAVSLRRQTADTKTKQSFTIEGQKMVAAMFTYNPLLSLKVTQRHTVDMASLYQPYKTRFILPCRNTYLDLWYLYLLEELWMTLRFSLSLVQVDNCFSVSTPIGTPPWRRW